MILKKIISIVISLQIIAMSILTAGAVEDNNDVQEQSNEIQNSFLEYEPSQIYTGDHHTVIVNNRGAVETYGSNQYNQLGKTYESADAGKHYVEGLTNVEKVSTYSNHNLALLYGEVWAWGDSSRGQCGIEGITIDYPRYISFNTSADFVDISAGGWFSLALDEQGYVWAWGDNDYGQLGQGEIGGHSTEPHTVCDTIYQDPFWGADLSGVSKISAGKYHALALTSNGEVYGWGFNGNEHCFSENNDYIVDHAIKISGLPQNIVGIEAGFQCSFFWTDEGRVYVMGSNVCGQIGAGEVGICSQPMLLDLENIVDVESNNGHTLFLTSDGKVFACGVNTSGQLGIGYKNSYQTTPVKVHGEGYKQIAAAGYYSLLYKCNEEYPAEQVNYRNATIYAMGTGGGSISSDNRIMTYPTKVIEIENIEDVGPFEWNDDNLRPIDAISVSQMESSTNFYGQPLQVNYTKTDGGGGGCGKYSYLKFDVSNVKKERISSAKLHLYLSEDGGDTRASTREIGVYDTYSNEWDGRTMTWDNGRVGFKSLINSFEVSANGYLFDEDDVGWHDIDITDYLKNHCIDDELSLGLKMISTQEHEVRFVSGIYNDSFALQDMHDNRNIPVLEIKYEPEENTMIKRVSYIPSGDTYIDQQHGNTNFFKSELLGVNYTAEESSTDYWGQYTYLDFDISNIDIDTLLSAKLYLYVDESSDTRTSTRTIGIYEGNACSRMYQVTWKDRVTSNQDRCIGTFEVNGNGSRVTDAGWREIDLSDYLKEYDGNILSLNVKMISNQAHPVKIRSCEHTKINTRPRLVIENKLIDISDNHAIDISTGKTKLYKYVPKTDDNYIFSSVGASGATAVLLDGNLNQLAESNNIDDGFKIEYNLEKNRVYYIKVSSNSAINTGYKLYVETPLIITIQ